MTSKTETQIAESFKYKIKKAKKCCGIPLKKSQEMYCPFCYSDVVIMSMHKSSCQRFLEFLEAIRFTSAYKGTTKYIKDMIDKECADLKQAIKLYNEAGI